EFCGCCYTWGAASVKLPLERFLISGAESNPKDRRQLENNDCTILKVVGEMSPLQREEALQLGADSVGLSTRWPLLRGPLEQGVSESPELVSELRTGRSREPHGRSQPLAGTSHHIRSLVNSCLDIDEAGCRVPAVGAAWGPGWGRPAALRHLVVREKRSAAVTGDLTMKPLEAKTRVTVLRLAARGLQGCTDIRATRKGKPRADTPTGSLLGFCLDGWHLGFYSNYSTELSVAATSKGRRGLGNMSPRTARTGPGVAKALSGSLGHTVLWVPWKLSCASIKLQRGAGRLRTPSCGILSEKRGQRPNGGAASRSGTARASPSLSSQQQQAGDARPRPLRAGLWWGTRPAVLRNPTPRHGVRERRARRLVQPRCVNLKRKADRRFAYFGGGRLGVRKAHPKAPAPAEMSKKRKALEGGGQSGLPEEEPTACFEGGSQEEELPDTLSTCRNRIANKQRSRGLSNQTRGEWRAVDQALASAQPTGPAVFGYVRPRDEMLGDPGLKMHMQPMVLEPYVQRLIFNIRRPFKKWKLWAEGGMARSSRENPQGGTGQRRVLKKEDQSLERIALWAIFITTENCTRASHELSKSKCIRGRAALSSWFHLPIGNGFGHFSLIMLYPWPGCRQVAASTDGILAQQTAADKAHEKGELEQPKEACKTLQPPLHEILFIWDPQ
ncbi:hypothetical protein EI555_001393, partial [Monodon monoceros]